MAARSTAASGLSGALAEKIRQSQEARAGQATADQVTANEIARNTALAGGKQAQLNMDYQKERDLKSDENAKNIAEQQFWGGLFSGIGSLVGGVAGAPAKGGGTLLTKAFGI